MKEFIFIWIIENISWAWHKKGDYIVSPTFIATSMLNSAWLLYLYPRGREDSDYLSFRLRREFQDQGPEYLAVNVELSCVTADNSEVHKYFIPESFTNFTNDRYSDGFQEPYFMQRQEVFGRRKALYLPQDTLTLRCRMWKDCGDINEFDQSIGRTQLVIERIVLAEDFDIENSVEKTIDIRSKLKNKILMTISILYNDNMIDVGIDSNREEKMGFSTCRLSLVNKWLGKKIFEHKIRFFGRPTKKVWRLPISDKIWHSKIGDADESNCTFTTELVYSTGKENGIMEKDCTPKISEFLSNYVGCFTSGDPKYFPNMSEDLLELVTEKYLCDMELKVLNRSFSVHKFVLCARSPVFLAMLTSAMKEKEYGCIEIDDISADMMAQFLDFLYSDNIAIFSWNEATGLLYVADKYQVKRLKFLCFSYLLNNINIDNICELLMLADSYNDNELKQKVNNIIWENDKLVFGSDVWQKFTEEKLELANETMLSKYKGKGNQNSIKMYDELIYNHPKIEDDFRSLYASRIASDIVIKTANRSYPAYKAVIGASSLILKDMLLNDLIYESTNIIEIADLEDDIVSEMLFFMHTNFFQDIQWDIAKKLYHAAVVYKIPRLKFKCSCFLIENLKVSNATEVLLLAHNHHDGKLKSVIQDYICVLDEEIFRSDEWDDFCQENSCLALAIMRAKYRII